MAGREPALARAEVRAAARLAVPARGPALAELWRRWDVTARRAFASQLVDRVTVLPARRRGRVPFDPRDVDITPGPWADGADPSWLAVPVPAPRTIREIALALLADWGETITAPALAAAAGCSTRAARLALWRMERAGELDLAVPGSRGHSHGQYAAPATAWEVVPVT
jgi:hypothetical protein